MSPFKEALREDEENGGDTFPSTDEDAQSAQSSLAELLYLWARTGGGGNLLVSNRKFLMFRPQLFGSFLIVANFASAAVDTPNIAARNFMAANLKPNPASVPLHEVLKKHVSTGLLFQLRALDAAEKIAGKCDPGPGIYEGDLFTSYAESAERFNVLACRVNKTTARCPIELEAGSPQKDLLRWRDTLVLINENGHWRVSDVDRSDRAGPKLASTEISAMICGVAAMCPSAKWPNPAMHRTCKTSRVAR